jgi:hypothetical protein
VVGGSHAPPELIAAIYYFIEHYNERAHPFTWTKTPEQIIAKATKQQATSGTPYATLERFAEDAALALARIIR